MRKLLSAALPAPRDEPQQRDVIDAAMDWGTRRRRRDRVLTGAAALAVIAVGAGVAAISGGSGTGSEPVGGRQPVSVLSSPAFPSGSWWTPYCQTADGTGRDLAEYCKLYNDEQSFDAEFITGSAKYLRAALPPGFTLKAVGSRVLVLTGPNGKTNYLFPSVEPASTLDGHPLSCGTPAPPGCVLTSTAGGTVVVNGDPSGEPSAGYVGDGQKDPRVDILLGTSIGGGIGAVPAPTSAVPLLNRDQQARLLTDPGFLAYAKAQLQHQQDIKRQLRGMAPPPSPTGSSFPAAPGSFSPPSGSPSGSWSPPPDSLSSGS
jgi:hypothetical protein